MADERGEETAMAAGPSAEVTPAQVALITQTVETMIRALANRGEPSSGGPSGDASGRAEGLYASEAAEGAGKCCRIAEKMLS